VTGYPTVYVDGINAVVGASNCASMTATYAAAVESRLGDTDGMSPIAIASSITINGGNVTMTGTFKLIDPVHLSNLRATLLLYENNINGPSDPHGNHIWNLVTRKIYDQNITLTNPNDQVVVTTTLPVGSWNPANLAGVAYVQNTATKEMIQAQLLGHATAFDYSLYFAKKLGSVPAGNGMVTFHATVTNISNATETVDLQPGTPFGDWTVDYLVCGDSNPHTGLTAVTLTPNQACEFQVRVHTNAMKQIRTGTFKVTSESTGRLQETTLRVFNGSPAILFVDNDGSSYQGSFINALNNDGYLFDNWDTQQGGAPGFSRMNGFDILIWHTAGRVSNSAVLTSADAANMMSFMDQGGAVFVESNYYLNSLQGQGNTFVNSYLGAASWTVDKAYTQMNGVSGDVIGNGMNLPLHFNYPSWAKGDDVVPGPTATTDFLAPDGSHAMIRNTMVGGAKSVFMAERFDAVSETDADPNNTRVLVHRIIDWLTPAGTADTGPITPRFTSGIEQARPNPFQQGTDISFALSSAAAVAPVRLEIFDLGGRMVAKVLDGVMTPGVHVQRWNGRNTDGTVAKSGVYFARLTTREGARSAKLILLK